MNQNVELESSDFTNNLNRVIQVSNTPSDEEIDNKNKQDGDAGDNAQDAEKVKPKRIRNPQPKFNEGTLRGHRGLPALPRIFKRISMKGQGHEKENLSAIMRTYSYWCHRMFPKYQFGDCIEKLEKLGNKKGTVAYMQKMRSGLLEDETAELFSTSNAVDNDDRIESNLDIAEEESINMQTAPKVLQMEVTEDVMEKIRANRERALQIRANKQREEEAKKMRDEINEIENDEQL